MNKRWRDPIEFLPAVDVQALLDGLTDTNYSTIKLAERVAAMRELPIVLLACPIPTPECYGWWLTSPLCEFIVYERDTFVSHQNHIIFHELAHILLGHQTVALSQEKAHELLSRCHSLELVASAQGRVYAGIATTLQDTARDADVLLREMADVHAALKETEAESLATLLQRELIRRVGFMALTHPSQNHTMRQIVEGLRLDH